MKKFIVVLILVCLISGFYLIMSKKVFNDASRNTYFNKQVKVEENSKEDIINKAVEKYKKANSQSGEEVALKETADWLKTQKLVREAGYGKGGIYIIFIDGETIGIDIH